MADRSVSVRLRAEIDDFRRGMKSAADAVTDVGKRAEETGKRSTTGLAGLTASARTNDQAWRTVGTTLTAFGVAAAAGVGLAISRFSAFDQAMSNVQASTMESAENMQLLRDAALDAGKRTVFSASEAAGAIEELAKAGISTTAILNGGLNGALDLAAAGGIQVAEAASVAASAMTQFSLSGNDVTHIADLLAAGAGKAQGGVTDMGQALKQSGLVAAQFGLSIEDTVGTLTAFASAGMIGSDAGTSLRTMLLRLANPTDEVRGLMADLGITAYDTQGNFVGLADLAGQLQDKIGGLEQAQRDQYLAMIFGQDAIRGANILMREGEQGILDWTDAVDQQGFAADMAAARLDNLKGDLEELGGSFETMLIGLGEGADGPLRSLTQGLTDAVNKAGELPPAVQGGALILGGLTATVGLLGGGLALALPKAVQFYDALGQIGPLGIKAQGGIQKLGGALPSIGMAASVAVGVWALGSAIGELGDMSAPAVAGLEKTTEALADMNDEVDSSSVDRLFEDFGRTGTLMGKSTGQVHDFASAVRSVVGQQDHVENFLSSVFNYDTEKSKSLQGIKQIDASLARLVQEGKADQAAEQFNNLTKSAGLTWSEIAELDPLMTSYHEAVTAAANGTDEAATETEAMAAALGTTAEATATAEEEMSSFAETLQTVGESFISPIDIYTTKMQELAQASADKTEDATDSWQDFTDDVTLSLNDFATELEKQIAAQENWRSNLVAISQRGGEEVAGILAAMGVEGANITEQMAGATTEDFERMKNALIEESRLGGAGAARALETELGVMAAIGRTGAAATASAIAQQLGIGADEVARIAAQYGVNLASGINPLLGSLGRPPVTMNQQAGRAYRGALEFADGGIENHIAQIATAGTTRIWKEPETGGEAYIPLAPEKRSRSLQIWRETGSLLGAQRFAGGGFSTPEDVPRPPGTGQYGPPLSTAGSATMEEGYSEVIEFLKKNSLAGAGDLVSLGKQLQQMGFRVSEHPAFGGVTAGGHMDGSYHYRGRAIDVNFGPGGRSAAETAAINALMPKLAGLNFAEKLWGDAVGHGDHLHLAMAKGGLLNPWVRDQGGPLLPGYTYNGTGAPETVVRGAGITADDLAAAFSGMSLSLEIEGRPVSAIARAAVSEAQTTRRQAMNQGVRR